MAKPQKTGLGFHTFELGGLRGPKPSFFCTKLDAIIGANILIMKSRIGTFLTCTLKLGTLATWVRRKSTNHPKNMQIIVTMGNGQKFYLTGEIPTWLLRRLITVYGRKAVQEIRNSWQETKRPQKMSPQFALRFFRQQNGLSQTNLGIAIGKINRQKVSDMEKGRRPISKNTAKRLSDFFNTPIDTFL